MGHCIFVQSRELYFELYLFLFEFFYQLVLGSLIMLFNYNSLCCLFVSSFFDVINVTQLFKPLRLALLFFTMLLSCIYRIFFLLMVSSVKYFFVICFVYLFFTKHTFESLKLFSSFFPSCSCLSSTQNILPVFFLLASVGVQTIVLVI